jgi:D-alanine transaminase
VITARRAKPAAPGAVQKGIGVITLPDIRWRRCDIKSVSLLPNVLAKQAALDAGAYEAWLVDDQGFVTEGSSTNAWIVTQAGELITRNAESAILNGVTRLAVLSLASTLGIAFFERPFTVAEAKAAREAFLTSSTNLVLPVISINGQRIGPGVPGTVSLGLRQAYENSMTRPATGGATP